MKIRLRARGVIYVIEQSLEDFAPISDPMGENVDEITTKVGDLKIDGQSRTPIRLNIDKKRQYLKDDATAVSILMTRLNEDDESLIDEYPTAKSFWDHISSKYSRTSPMTANENLTAIQTFNFNEYGSIVLAWDKLKEFRRKLGVANPDMRSAYNDVALFLVLSRSLPDEYTSTIDSLDVQSVLTVDEKLKHLEMKELRLKASSEHAHASFKQKSKKFVPIQHRKDYSSSSDGAESSSSRCILCGEEKHWLRRCPHLLSAQKFIRAEKNKKVIKPQRSSSSTKNRRHNIKSENNRPFGTKKSKGYVMQEELPDSEFPTESGTDDNTDEVCALSKEQIKVVPSSSWPSDTACTSHMSDKIYLFSNLIPIKRRTIRVGGGVMYAEFKGSARLVCEDGSYTTLPDTLFVPNLGVNLLSARRMCDTGLRGYFDSNRMYFKLENKIMIHAKIHHGLYVVNHVSKKLESLIHKKPDNSAFAVMDVNPFQVEDGSMTPVVSPMADYDQTNDKDSSEYIGQSEKERYMLWHRRFAHLGPEKLRQRRDKLVDRGRVGVFMGYSTTTDKQFKIYSPDLGYTTRASVIKVDETVRGGTLELRLRNIESGPQGVNLLSARRMCDTGLRGYFDSNRMYFKLENKIMIHAKIHHGLYVVNHVSKKLESLIHKKPDNSAFAVMDVNPFQVEDGSMTPVVSPMADYDQTNDKDSSEYIGQSEKERYMLWHRRFAHLGPEKLRQRRDKLVDRGRVGVFMGYSTTTDKQFKIYSPDLGYTTRASVIKVDETVRGGTLELRLRNIESGPQGTCNVHLDRKPRGRPPKHGSTNFTLSPIKIATLPSVCTIGENHTSLNTKLDETTSGTIQEPAEPAPIELDPVESVPVESVPVESVPVESVPVESVPVESIIVEVNQNVNSKSKKTSLTNNRRQKLDPSTSTSSVSSPTKTIETSNISSSQTKKRQRLDEIVEYENSPKRNPRFAKNEPRLRYFTRGAKRRSQLEEILQDNRDSKKLRALFAQLYISENDYEESDMALTAFAYPAQ
ncbi:hypothetical protein FRX31_003074, partial [Thalictrum thalictroides]